MILRILVVLLIFVAGCQDLSIRRLDDGMRKADNALSELQKKHNALCEALDTSGWVGVPYQNQKGGTK